MLIDYTELSEEALRGVAEQYVLSQLESQLEMVDKENILANCTDEVIQQVKRKALFVEYSENDDSVYLISAESAVSKGGNR